MGRDAGFIALNAAIASGAESVLIPEEVTNIENLVKEIKEHKAFSLMIFLLAKENRQLAGYELLQTILSVGLSFGERDDQIPSIVIGPETVVSGRRARNADTIVTREVCDDNIGLSGRIVGEVYSTGSGIKCRQGRAVIDTYRR
jgi:hypothetical protein